MDFDPFGFHSQTTANINESFTEWNWTEPYNITLVINLDSNAMLNSETKRYRINDLFDIAGPNKAISFEDIASMPRSDVKKARYPRIFDIYPQDVPMRDVVNRIKAGMPVSYVSKFMSQGDFIIFILCIISTLIPTVANGNY